MAQRFSRPFAGPGFGSDRSGLWSVEGLELVALATAAILVGRGLAIGANDFLGWIYVFIGAARMLLGAVHRGPGLAWMLLSAVLAMAVGLGLLLVPLGGADGLGEVLGFYFLGQAVCAFGLASGAGVRLACSAWLAWLAVGEILLSAVALAMASDERRNALVALAALELFLQGVTLLVMGHRWETTAPVATRPNRGPPISRPGSRTYGRPWSRPWR